MAVERVRKLLSEVYSDMLDVLASGRPTGSTEKLADELRAFLGLPAWPSQETGRDERPKLTQADVDAFFDPDGDGDPRND